MSFTSFFFILSVNSEADAMLIAHPTPENFTSFTLLLSIISWISI